MTNFIKKILVVALLLIGVDSAFALECKGTIFVKAPASWGMVTLEAGGMFPKLTVGASGWYGIEASAAGQGTSFRVNSTGTLYPAQWIDKAGYDVANNESLNTNAFTCADLAAGDLYIYENPSVPGKTAYGNNPPNAKYLYVMISPEYESWMSSVPMISMDGGITGKPLKADPEKCGWYSYVWFNETISDNVVFYRDDAPITDGVREDMIGMNGNWEEGLNATPIPLGALFDLVDTLYFVSDENQFLSPTDDGWYNTYPEGVQGECSFTLANIVYDTDAKLHPAFSCYVQGGEGCQKGALDVGAALAVSAVNACIGVTPGLVEPFLDISVPQRKRKPKLSTLGKKCFIDEVYFNMLFNYTQGVNEVSCYDMPFTRSSDGKWEFDSDFNKTYVEVSAGKFDSIPGGFFPVENSTDESVLAAYPNQVPVPAARVKRGADGPIFYGPDLRELDPIEGAPYIDLLCNGPGWSGGYDCTGMFNSGDDIADIAAEFVGADCVIGWSCPDNAPKGWQFYKEGSETKMNSGYPRWEGMRNQHFCVESHSKFTQKPGLRFSFRGDDDIWVFIDNKLAVDLGGTHLAAPGYVDLDKFEGASGPLETGKQYNLDIFFCDRRTTMSNVRIKTNMNFMQKTDIEVNTIKDRTNPAVSTYDICYTKTGDESCASAMNNDAEGEQTFCGPEIVAAGLDIKVVVVNGNSLSTSPVVLEASTPGIYKGGINLTDITKPVIDKDALTLGAGRYTLFMVIDGKSKQIASFKVQGEVDVVYKDGIAKDTLGNPLKNGNYKLVKSAMGGEMVPVYVSSVALSETDANKVDILPYDAMNIPYVLEYNNLMKVYYKTETGEYKRIANGDSRTIPPSGIDTVYATVPLEALEKPSQDFTIGVKGRPNKQTINFYLPRLAFVDSDDSLSFKPVTGDQRESDGSYGERWVGNFYDFYVVVLKPDESGSYYRCSDCNISIKMGSGTSAGISFDQDVYYFQNGFARISMRSSKSYRFSDDPNPARIVVQADNDAVNATYAPIYFREPPTPFPVFADVFDVKGAASNVPLQVYSKYQADEYLDGIADSVAIYYDRRIHKDSLPDSVCILWDSASADSYETYAAGFFSYSQESSAKILCNAVVYKSSMSCRNEDSEKYCDPLITVGGLTLSDSVKTAGTGKVYSFITFEDLEKVVHGAFTGSLYDRIAPVPIMAGEEVVDGNIKLSIVLSENIEMIEGQKSPLDFYLASMAEKLDSASAYFSATDNTDNVIETIQPPVSSYRMIEVLYTKPTSSNNAYAPAVGDAVRLGGNMETPVWADLSGYASSDYDGTYRGSKDVDYHWNSPTGLKDSRLPSPWVPVIKADSPAFKRILAIIGHEQKVESGSGGSGENDDGHKPGKNPTKTEYADPSFHIEMVGPFKFAIVFDDSTARTQKSSYAITDLNGSVMGQGAATEGSVVTIPRAGSYIVRIGRHFQRVNVH